MRSVGAGGAVQPDELGPVTPAEPAKKQLQPHARPLPPGQATVQSPRGMPAHLATARQQGRPQAGQRSLMVAMLEHPRCLKTKFLPVVPVTAVAVAADADLGTLRESGYTVEVGKSQPGFVRAFIRRGAQQTKVEWIK